MERATVDDERILSALMTHRTYQEAADSLGISRRTIYSRLKDAEFIVKYQRARAEVIHGAVASLNSHIGEAVEVMAEIMNDTQNNPAVRLQAAQCVLTNADKFTNRVTVLQKDIDSAKQAAAYPDFTTDL